MTDALKNLVESIILPLEGWCTPEKAFSMMELIFKIKPQVVVEIGVFGGRSLVPQAMALKEVGNGGKAYGIDPWRHLDTLEGNLSEADKKWWANVDLNEIHRGCMGTIWNNRLEDYAIIIRSPSQHCPQLFGGGIDVLHIDGTHSEEASIRDVQLYLPQVLSGGYVFFDDTDWTTTKRAVAMMDESCERVDKVGNCVLFKRK